MKNDPQKEGAIKDKKVVLKAIARPCWDPMGNTNQNIR